MTTPSLLVSVVVATLLHPAPAPAAVVPEQPPPPSLSAAGPPPRLAALPVKGRLIASPAEVSPGRLVLLSGIIGDDLPRRVWLQVRRTGGWTRLAHTTTRLDGLFRFSHRAPRAPATLHFRVLAPASHHFGIGASVTPTRRVRVTADTSRPAAPNLLR